jgi:hypothetical protein
MSRHLTAEELCHQAGITPGMLDMFEVAGVLLPGHMAYPPRYRLKLVRWAQRLAYLCREGWTLEEMHYWAKVWRWQTGNPMLWPPRKPVRMLDVYP